VRVRPGREERSRRVPPVQRVRRVIVDGGEPRAQVGAGAAGAGVQPGLCLSKREKRGKTINNLSF